MRPTLRQLEALKITGLRERIATSFWAVPIAAVSAAIVLAVTIARLDHHLQQRGTWITFGGGPESARELLSTIATSLLNITGLVFSITILVLQLASQQFSPRVLRTFLRDRITQFSMGMFIGSFVYALVLLPTIQSRNEHQSEFVPAAAVFFAFLLALVSVAVLIRYIHHMAHSIRAVHIMRRIWEETRQCIEQLYPEAVPDSEEQTAGSQAVPAAKPEQRIVHEGPAGVLMNVNEGGLLAFAIGCDVTIGIVPTVGDFVPHGAPLFDIWGRGTVEPRELSPYVRFGLERTPYQDPAFGLRQLVDIAERALSPGINDPTTATQALDHIHDLLRMLGGKRIPAPLICREDGVVRVVLPSASWELYVRLGVEEIRQYGHGSIQIVQRIQRMLADLMTAVPEARRPVLVEQLELLRSEATGPARSKLT